MNFSVWKKLIAVCICVVVLVAPLTTAADTGEGPYVNKQTALLREVCKKTKSGEKIPVNMWLHDAEYESVRGLTLQEAKDHFEKLHKTAQESLSIEPEDIIFDSALTPLIILWMTTDDIRQAALSSLVESMALYNDGEGSNASLPIFTGDVDGDGIATSRDARLVLQCAVGLVSLESWQIAAVDLTGEGMLDSRVARIILQIAVGSATV